MNKSEEQNLYREFQGLQLAAFDLQLLTPDR
jgi:hypothetical protein